jgi:hypothetical protein
MGIPQRIRQCEIYYFYAGGEARTGSILNGINGRICELTLSAIAARTGDFKAQKELEENYY